MMKNWKQWLKSAVACTLSLIAFAGCGAPAQSSSESVDDGMRTVSFELCTELETNYIADVEVAIGDVVMRPSVVVKGENPGNAEVDAWYTDAEYTNKWNFLTDTVEDDMTLYAKWINNYAITYYLGDSETPMFTDYLKEGEIFTKRSDLSDGYKSEGFYLDREHTRNAETEGVFGQPIAGNMDIYIDRSEQIYFSGDMIARRFVPQAAPSGQGSTAGTIQYVEDEEGGYAEMNFGYSTAADPHMLLENVTVDISKSQKISVTFKNLGKARTLKFYYVAWWDDQSKETVGGANHFSEKCAYTYYFDDSEKEMSRDGEWITKTFDLSGNEELANGHTNIGIYNGISLWGNASTLIKLRIDAGYVSESPEDLSNIILIKSIEGVSAPEYINTSDSETVAAMLQDDEAAKVEAAANAQQSINGWIFPKDNASVNTTDNVQLYDKAEGLLMYTEFRQTDANLVLKPTTEKKIDLDDLTTLTIRLRNYGYATQLKLTYRNKNSRSSTYDMVIGAQTGEVVEYKLNMFGALHWNGLLDSLTISYNSVGNDNAILFESVKFSEFEVIETPGINFNDKYTLGLTNDETMEVDYSHVGDLGTSFNVLTDGASFEKTYSNYTLIGYSALSLEYYMPEAGVTAVNVELTVDGFAENYKFEVTASDAVQTLQLPLTKTGGLDKVKVSFEGVGEIQLNEIRWLFDETSAFDFSSEARIAGWDAQWRTWLSYADHITAAQYAISSDTQTDIVKYYWGYSLEHYKTGLGNISLEGKTKLVLIYQNQSTVETKISIGLGQADKTEDDSWKTAFAEVYAAGNTVSTLQNNMKDGEWAALVIDLTDYAVFVDQETIDSKVATSFILVLWQASSIYIRGLAFI